jgi:dienelactone hydrolase
MSQTAATTGVESEVRIPVGRVELIGDLAIHAGSRGIVVFAHGSGSGRHSTRNRFVANRLQSAGLSTLLVDLLTEEEEVVDERTAHLRFDIGMLAQRLVGICDWLAGDERTAELSVGYFGASTGGGAALVAAARQPDRVAAVVSRGGRPDLAGAALPAVRAPTLLIVGGRDDVVLRLNEDALDRLGAPEKKLVVVPGATHLFEEPGKLEIVAKLAADWLTQHLAAVD